ncbi:hypothetical protein DYI37_03320 [Fulvimarina endophytica]|uniref:Uncharacterized protein n=1 Tax=Fulvimarina endophytica TaxID=2293836 RepID=A0A371XB68_9HYPH|nr:hypothetical protein [Fulvimarina endophytica]RFC66486.1 hypothetical protein DYI37_03320 [Fulvimarina endophytica]
MAASNMPTVRDARQELIQCIRRADELFDFLYDNDEAFAAAQDDDEFAGLTEVTDCIPVIENLDASFAEKYRSAPLQRSRPVLRGLNYDRFDDTGRRI